MSARKKLSDSTHFEVVYSSARRCCMCYALSNDFGQKPGQIAHIDQDRGNDAVSNLAWLCLTHHDEYDSRTSQSKGFTEAELRRYRDLLHQQVVIWRQRQPHAESQEVFQYKQQLLQSNSTLFFFAAYGARGVESRTRLLADVADPDFRAQLVEALNFIDEQADEVASPSRGELMARYIGSTAEGQEDLNTLLALASLPLSAMNEHQRTKALFQFKSDTIRSGLMLLYKIRLEGSSGGSADE